MAREKLKLTGRSAEERAKLLAEKRRALSDFYFQSSGSKNTDVKLARNLRRDIARILTVAKLTGR